MRALCFFMVISFVVNTSCKIREGITIELLDKCYSGNYTEAGMPLSELTSKLEHLFVESGMLNEVSQDGFLNMITKIHNDDYLNQQLMLKTSIESLNIEMANVYMTYYQCLYINLIEQENELRSPLHLQYLAMNELGTGNYFDFAILKAMIGSSEVKKIQFDLITRQTIIILLSCEIFYASR